MCMETTGKAIDSNQSIENEITPGRFNTRSLLFDPWFPHDRNLVGAGFLNFRNSCYLNAVLQCIIHTVPMVEKLRSSYKFHSCEDVDVDYFCSLCALRVLVDKALVNSGRSIFPAVFLRNLSKISLDFQFGQQEDAHEFLRCLLDNLHNCCLDPHSRDKPLSMNEDSLVKQVYGGRLISQLRCSVCGHCSNTFEPLLDFSLEIADADTLVDALNSFTNVEEIEETKFTCEGCKAEVVMEKQTKIDQAPAVISFHLKRFKNNIFGIEKIHKPVEYPLELELKPFINCTNDEEETMYDLYAVLVHFGRYFFSGHYYCYVRSSPTTWHLMDDDKVDSVSENIVLDEKAYILFYIKKGVSPWFSSLMDSQILHDTSPKSVLEPNNYRHSPSSTEEACSSSSRETTERDKGADPHHDASDNLIIADPSARDHSLVSVTCNNISPQDGTLPMTQLESARQIPAPDHTTINMNMSDDNSSESEKENLIPPVNVRPKGNTEVEENAPMATKDIDPRLRKLLRSLDGSRRLRLMRFLPRKNKFLRKRGYTRGGRPLRKRRLRPLKLHSSDGKQSLCLQPTRRQQLATVSSGSLSPQSLRRGLQFSV